MATYNKYKEFLTVTHFNPVFLKSNLQQIQLLYGYNNTITFSFTM